MQHVTYTLFAPLYDFFLRRLSAPWRQLSLSQLKAEASATVLLIGVGTGLDFPHLPTAPHYLAMDANAAMLKIAQEKLRQALKNAEPNREALKLQLYQGDVWQLPHPDASLDAVIAHLIIAVTAKPERTLAEAVRVLKPGGQLLVIDKFLQPGEKAWLKRAINPVAAALATRLDVEFSALLAAQDTLKVVVDTPLFAKGWFRFILLEKTCGNAL
jgi:ubiquinone/menaquinone biosynthesis C-methylase UbiE